MRPIVDAARAHGIIGTVNVTENSKMLCNARLQHVDKSALVDLGQIIFQPMSQVEWVNRQVSQVNFYNLEHNV